MTLLVSGCSITHGAELYNTFMHPKNIELSYSAHLANKLKLPMINVALSAASNEYIFHSLIEQIDSNKDITSVLVMWTTTGRLYWKNKRRHYFMNGNFASSMVDLVDFKMHERTMGDCWITGDNDQIVDDLSTHYKFFIMNYFDDEQESIKLTHYRLALEAVCKNKNLKLVQLTWDSINDIGLWSKECRHPNSQEHIKIADMIYEKYYENKQ